MFCVLSCRLSVFARQCVAHQIQELVGSLDISIDGERHLRNRSAEIWGGKSVKSWYFGRYPANFQGMFYPRNVQVVDCSVRVGGLLLTPQALTPEADSSRPLLAPVRAVSGAPRPPFQVSAKRLCGEQERTSPPPTPPAISPSCPWLTNYLNARLVVRVLSVFRHGELAR